MEKPHTRLDDCLKILLSCFRARTSILELFFASSNGFRVAAARSPRHRSCRCRCHASRRRRPTAPSLPPSLPPFRVRYALRSFAPLRRWVDTHCGAIWLCLGSSSASLGWSTGLTLGKPKQQYSEGIFLVIRNCVSCRRRGLTHTATQQKSAIFHALPYP